ncbi:MAG: alpha/beta fold hydrolase [Candidatus Eisenbacteria bacterium]|nr:alpha/beta fold hydrolase [Candidatus Eisenbacteria bacterium]
MRRFAPILLLAVLAASPVLGADARPANGIWEGKLTGLQLVLHVERGADGRLIGTLDSPNQNAMGMVIDTLTFAGDSLRFVMSRPRATYRARLSADGSTLNGEWAQNGFTLALAMKHYDKLPEPTRPQNPKPPFPYTSEDVVFPGGEPSLKLAGTITAPTTGGPFAAVVLLTGSGPQDRNEALFGHKPFLVLADHLTRHGIAVLRMDDRGVGGSTGDSHANSADFAKDALAGVEYLKTRKDIDPKRMGLIGHSEGGIIATIAGTTSRDVAFMVFMAGPGISGDSLLLLQNAAVLRATGLGDSAAAPQIAAMRRVLKLVRQGADSVAVFGATRDMVAAQLATLTPAQRASVGSPDSIAVPAAGIYRSSWMRFFIKFDPAPALATFKGPVLAINGGRDVQVPPKENLPAIERALKQGGNRDVTVRELPGLNHLFQHCASCLISEYGTIEETIAPAALDTISTWITARTTAKR